MRRNLFKMGRNLCGTKSVKNGTKSVKNGTKFVEIRRGTKSATFVHNSLNWSVLGIAEQNNNFRTIH